MIDPTEFSNPGDVPALDWLDVADITVESLYQRPIDQSRVDDIVRGFTWRSFGALVVVPQEGGGYHVTDGQHRLEAARRHPHVTVVPAVIVKADDVHQEAEIFVGINKNRKNVSALELFFAKLTANDPDAVEVVQVSKKAGIRIPKCPREYRPCDSIAVTAIQGLISKHGATRAQERLRMLVAARFAPITAAHIKAADLLLTDPEFADHISIEDLTTALTIHGNSVEADVKLFASTHRVPLWRAMASIWFQKCRKRRSAGRPS